MIFNCVLSIKECDVRYAQFVHGSFSLVISISQNQVLISQRRWDQLLGFASIWPSDSHSPAAQLFCITLLNREIQMPLNTTARKQSFNHTPIMNLIEKYSHVLESSDLVSVILNLL
jgi:hypothetical protein